ncbi:hypothetical protein G6F46_002808 [Rhizopus delemar]|uniref:magnesium chelatase n=2 Tax=Rhizopus TaxID=4842 RepID=A0A9P6ZBN7_9FUNG|nr:hypothetical protein G6F43_003637 [Rhizopus delemar]KAG1549688.1 hypothetical protein G6F51_002905 [Rhizopus arrhizus]KAG1465715.1 hypothetical protein G6F55_000954 [Rhizopus delemar]KAG1500272.1 hypothetical protein G6F54_003830 [Rhizopus delemar]KAG1516108.1 hypothetical protein G6F53_002409 [Rhizopus delemar]
MSQDSKEWIKSRMNALKKQAGFAFNQDVFISILLCLISGRDKHLLLTAPPGRLKEVTHLTSQICKCLFGFTTAQMTCKEQQTQDDLVEALFKEDNEPFYKTAQHKSRSFNTLDTQISEEESLLNMTPVSPVDFTLRRTKQPFGSSPSFYTKDQQPKRSSMTRIVQTLIIEDLDKAEESIQTILLDLMVNKELYLSNIRYNVPKPFFLIITVLPHDFNRLSINSQLMDRFFISFQFEEEMLQNYSLSLNPSTRAPRRQALMKQDEIKALAEKAKKVYVHIDISRYVRDIVVGIRTHPRVKGGVTARSSQDLVTVTKSLATLFERSFLTPDLVTIATEKVFSHRLHMLAINERDDEIEREDMDSNLAFDIVAEILHIINVPI